MRNREQPIITMAREGHMLAEINRMMVTIVLNNGTLHNIQGQDNQVIRFKRYQLQIPLKPPTRIDGDDVTKIGKGSMTQTQLLAAANAPERSPKDRIMYLAEYNHRLVLPVGCFILSLLGMPLGLQAGPGKKGIGIPMGLGFFVLYYLSFTVARVMVEDLTLPLVLGMWAPNILFLFITLYVFHRAEQERTLLPKPLQEFLNDTFDRVIVPISSRFMALAHNLINRRRKKVAPLKETAQSPRLLVHANSLSMVYHLPGCEHYSCENCTIDFKDTRVAEDAGFTPCRFCKKLINKQNGQDPS